ncbi:MAG: L,D-transpeptidase family protein [Gammaproteobacteria bacterium]|nr:L,D-transpeptidase family protein [Gammaproteobacteria bacterium]
MSKIVITIIAAIFLSPMYLMISAAHAAKNQPPSDIAEQQLINIITLAEEKNWGRASELSHMLCADFPDFRAAQIFQQLIDKQTLPTPRRLVPLRDTDDENQKENLEAELVLRLNANRYRPQAGLVPDAIVTLNENIHYALLVDLDKSRLYLLQNESGDISVLADYYVGIGKQGAFKQHRGDLRTPVGIYTITNEMLDAALDELYGVGAWTLDYPNIWDKRLKRRGSGIWIHGVPRSTYSRAPYSSRGCVTLSNQIFTGIKPFITPGQTPVILDDTSDWIAPDKQRIFLDEIQKQFLQWQSDWSNRDFEQYIAHYSEQFQSGKENLQAWKQRKHATNRHKTFIRIQLKNVSIYRYPGESSLLQIDYRQHYESNNFNAEANKRQYWKREDDGRWRIVYEGLR